MFWNRGEKVRRYHHSGIPTSQPRPGERHIEHLKIFIVEHENSEYSLEWMRFETDAPIPELVRQVPHVAFEVSDLASELVGREILIASNSPSDGVRVAFIVENGAPIELMEFHRPQPSGSALRHDLEFELVPVTPPHPKDIQSLTPISR